MIDIRIANFDETVVKLNFTNMKTLIFCSLFLVLFYSSSSLYSQNGWVIQQTSTLGPIPAVYFLDSLNGWAVSDSGIIFSTSNQGNNWNKQVYDPSQHFASVMFNNLNTGWVGGYVSARQAGTLLHTTNGGINWSASTGMALPYDIFSFRGDTIWYSTHTGYVYRSIDDGITWSSPILIFPSLELYVIRFVNGLTGWTGGGVYSSQIAYLYKTTDGGLTWFNQITYPGRHMRGIDFVNASTGMVSTQEGFVYRTTNGGTNWNVVLNNIGVTLYWLQLTDANSGYIAGSGNIILKTANTGLSWTIQLPPAVPPTVNFYRTSFVSPTLGWVSGDSGIIIKTTNGGELLGVSQIGNSVPTGYALKQNYPNPFNPSTTITFDLPKSAYVKLTIYDALGRQVDKLTEGYFNEGSFKTTWDGSNFPSGIYFYRLNAGPFEETKKMVLTK